MNQKTELAEQARRDCQQLVIILAKRPQQPAQLQDIIDVLNQVSQKVMDAKNPAALVNRLVNYIRSQAIAGKIHFPDEEEKLMVDLSEIGQKAGLNGQYMADFSDKSQFYSVFEEVPKH